MRTDCKIDENKSLRLDQIPLCSAGRPTHAKRGMFIEWSDGGVTTRMGRIIGVVTADDVDKPMFCVAMFLRGDVCERWVAAADVLDAWTGDGMFEKTAWFFGNDFVNTPPRLARRIFDMTIETVMELMK